MYEDIAVDMSEYVSLIKLSSQVPLSIIRKGMSRRQVKRDMPVANARTDKCKPIIFNKEILILPGFKRIQLKQQIIWGNFVSQTETRIKVANLLCDNRMHKLQ